MFHFNINGLIFIVVVNVILFYIILFYVRLKWYIETYRYIKNRYKKEIHEILKNVK